MLISFDKFLRSERLIKRLNQGEIRTRMVKALSDGGVHNRMRDLRIIFKAAMADYNNPQTGDIRIPYCPLQVNKEAQPKLNVKMIFQSITLNPLIKEY